MKGKCCRLYTDIEYVRQKGQFVTVFFLLRIQIRNFNLLRIFVYFRCSSNIRNVRRRQVDLECGFQGRKHYFEHNQYRIWKSNAIEYSGQIRCVVIIEQIFYNLASFMCKTKQSNERLAFQSINVKKGIEWMTTIHRDMAERVEKLLQLLYLVPRAATK